MKVLASNVRSFSKEHGDALRDLYSSPLLPTVPDLSQRVAARRSSSRRETAGKCFETPGVQPVFLDQEQAIDYANGRACRAGVGDVQQVGGQPVGAADGVGEAGRDAYRNR